MIFINNNFFNKKPCCGTGFVCPKTTALFFDKIWLSDEEAHRYGVPHSFLLSLDQYKEEFNYKYLRATIYNIGIVYY